MNLAKKSNFHFKEEFFPIDGFTWEDLTDYRQHQNNIWNFVASAPEYIKSNEEYLKGCEEDLKKSFCGQGLNCPGVLAHISSKNKDDNNLNTEFYYLIGHNCESRFSDDVTVIRYAQVVDLKMFPTNLNFENNEGKL
jgi:hypothetical protein